MPEADDGPASANFEDPDLAPIEKPTTDTSSNTLAVEEVASAPVEQEELSTRTESSQDGAGEDPEPDPPSAAEPTTQVEPTLAADETASDVTTGDAATAEPSGDVENAGESGTQEPVSVEKDSESAEADKEKEAEVIAVDVAVVPSDAASDVDKKVDGGNAEEPTTADPSQEAGAEKDSSINNAAETTAKDNTQMTEPDASTGATGTGDSSATNIVTVIVPSEDGGTGKTIRVEVVPPEDRKRWLGGFKDKETGIEYHNCSTQTYIRTRPSSGKVKFHREVQTKQVSSGVTNNQMTVEHASTQMTRPGAYVSEAGDRIVVPRPYFTADQWEERRLQAVIVLQSYLRRMRAIKYVKYLRQKVKEYNAWRAAEAARKTAEEEAEMQSRLERRLNPRTKDDFQLLYHGLEVWRQEQLEGMSELEGESRHKLQIELLQQQCNYLSAIDKLKNVADEENRERRIKKFFDSASAPRQWVEQEYQKVIKVETPEMLRGRELREVYYALKLTGIDLDERLDILLHVKLTVQEFKSKLTDEIIDLLNREAELLLRGTRESNLSGLRKRIQNLFLRFCEDPQYNPIAAKLRPEHRTKEEYAQGMIEDKSTGRYGSTTDFTLRSPGKKPAASNKTKKLTNIGTTRKDTTQHRRIMDAIRNGEIAKGYQSQVVFLMSVEDVSYLIDVIWGGASCLSQDTETFRLTLPRWNEHEEWSPWNCILLTQDEAETHEKLSKLNTPLSETYGAALYRAVTQRHLRAKGYFLSLVEAQQKRPEELEKDIPIKATLTRPIATI